MLVRGNIWIRGALAAAAAVILVCGQPPPQTNVPPGFFPRPMPQQPTAPPPPNPAQTSTPTVFGGLSLSNTSLTEVIDLLARQLKINYILDPRVRGGVILNTYGEIKDIDTRSLLETILRVNGFGMVKQGDLFRIVPLSDISHLPIPPEVDAKNIPEDDRAMLNLVFLKYVTVDELAKVLEPFIGENARMFAYTPANLLLLLDSRRSMRRTMELISLFDSDSLANQRVRIFEVKHGRPSDLAKELDTIAKSISLSEKNAPIKFLAVDRINSIIAVAPNSGAFVEVEKWLTRLDIPVKVAAGAVSNYVYRLRYGDAQSIGCSIQALFGQMSGYGGQGAIAACVAASGGAFGAGAGGAGGLYGGGGGPYSGAFGGGQYGGGQYGGGQYGGGQYGGGQYGQVPAGLATTPFAPPITPQGANPTSTGATDLTGTYLGNAQAGGQQQTRQPRVVANPFNNTLLIQASPQDYENILGLLKDLDVPPRQVLIEAKIYSIDLTHAFSSDVQAKLQQISGSNSTPRSHSFFSQVISDFGGGATNLSTAALVGKTRQLLAAVQLQESEARAKVLSSPSVIATDSIPASINVGTEVPTLTAQAVTGVQQGGNSLFANSVSGQNTGVTLSIVARVTPTGVVTMIINQEVSSAIPTTSSNISSPSFDKKSIQTQITVQDGDTVAIGGIIDERSSVGMSGIPVLHRIPIIGAAFGFRTYSKERAELIIFITPRVIYDSNQMQDATDELKGRLKMSRKLIKE